MRVALPVIAVALGLGLGGCGGSSEATLDVREELERRLAATSVGVCEEECVEHQAQAATCEEPAVRLQERDWYRCRVSYRPLDGEVPPPDEVCATLDERDGHVARPVTECAGP